MDCGRAFLYTCCGAYNESLGLGKCDTDQTLEAKCWKEYEGCWDKCGVATTDFDFDIEGAVKPKGWVTLK